MLARDGNVTGNRIGPARSSCAIHVGSYNANRESIYVQQQTISGEGLSGIAFSTNVPHTVAAAASGRRRARPSPARRDQMCTDCHVSKQNDNNAIMAQLLMQGTNYVNFIGRYCWVAAGDHGLTAVVVTERDEPQAVIGSTLHSLAFPHDYLQAPGARRPAGDRPRASGQGHRRPAPAPGREAGDPGRADSRRVPVRRLRRGRACGSSTSPSSTTRASRSGSPPPRCRRWASSSTCRRSTPRRSPRRRRSPPTRRGRTAPENHEQTVARACTATSTSTDKYEGLILVGAGTLLDGNPLNNFLQRELTFNPDGILCGAEAITIVGTYAYICCDAGLVVLRLDDPKKPKVTAVLGETLLKQPHAVQAQFRYAYVCDDEGIKVLDITDLAQPRVVERDAAGRRAQHLPGADLRLRRRRPAAAW